MMDSFTMVLVALICRVASAKCGALAKTAATSTQSFRFK
jgi:hypothetical protein